MPETIGEAFVRIRADLAGLQEELRAKLGPAVDGATSGLQSRFAGLGRSLGVALAPAAAGEFLQRSFDQVDQGLDQIRASTGATGKVLEDLGASMKRVAGDSIAPISQVGQTMAELAARTGLVGAPLETLTKQVLQLNTQLGNQASVATVTRVFGDWSIATDQQSGALDKLFRASQATGPPVDRLGQLLVQFGAPLRQLGFGFEQSAALLGKFEKEGVNTELVMGSLRIALGKMARAGEPTEETFQRVVGEIKAAGSASEANAKALELFGARAGPDMAAAIREGRFEIGALFGQIQGGTDTIAKAAKDTEDFGDRVAKAKNKLMGAIGPFGEFGRALGGIATVAGPLGRTLGPKLAAAFAGILPAIMPALAAIGPALLAALPFLAIAAAAIAAVVLIVKNWDKIKDFFAGLWGKVRDLARAALDAVVGFFTALPAKLAALALAAVTAYVNFYLSLPGRIGEVLGAIVGLFVELVPKLAKLAADAVMAWITFWWSLPGRVAEVLGAVAGRVAEAISAIAGKARELGERFVAAAVEFIRGLPGRIIEIISDIGNWSKDLLAKLANAGKRLALQFWEGFKRGLFGSPRTRMEYALLDAFDRMRADVRAFDAAFSPMVASVGGSLPTGGGTAAARAGGAGEPPGSPLIESVNVTVHQLDPSADAIVDAIGRKLGWRLALAGRV